MAWTLLRSNFMKGVILDVDGTLVDSNDLHAESWVDAFRAHGYDVGLGRVRPFIGMRGDRLLFTLASVEADSLEGRAIAATRRSIFRREYLPAVKPFPKVRELLQRMRDEGLELAVAGSSDGGLLDELLERTGASDLIRRSSGSSAVRSATPAPDGVLAALELLDLKPGEAAMLGDTPYDGDAASSARVPFVGVRSGGWSYPSLVEAIALYDDVADLLQHFDTSPFASR